MNLKIIILNGLLVIVVTSCLTIDSKSISGHLNDNSYQWNLEQIFIEKAWKITKGSPNITIAIIDTGIDFTHIELNHSTWINRNEIPDNDIDDDNNGYVDDINGWDWVSNDNNPGYSIEDPIHYHGTFIAGIISSKHDNHEIDGIAPNVKLMALRIIDSNQLISNIQGLIEAVDYAADNGADIISMSFYLEIGPPGFRSSIKNAILKGIPVIAASGNTFQSDGGGKAQLSIPASFEEVIAVGASNYNKERAGYSNYGTGLELVAPVGDENENNITHTIRSSILNNRFGYGYGTSYAAPQVAGVVSLLKTIRNNLTVEEIRYILHTTSIDIQDPKWDKFTGYGIINASAAVNLAKIFTTIPVYTTYSPWAFLTTISVMMPFLLIFLLATLKKIIYRNFRKDF